MIRITLLAALFACATATSAANAADARQMEENKKIVTAFYDAVLNQKDFDAASKFLGSRYTQHNPTAADGPEGLKRFVAFLKEKFPNNRSEIKRVFADGDYVIVHVHAVREPGRELLKAELVHARLAAFVALAMTDQQRPALLIDVGLVERQRFTDPQPTAPQDGDQRPDA